MLKNRSGENLNDGPLMDYQPVALPVEGNYNDYGMLENIVHDVNTEVLEKYFRAPIKAILQCVCDGRKQYGVEYTGYGSLMEHYGFAASEITPENLVKMGFTINKETQEVTHAELDRVTALIAQEAKKRNRPVKARGTALIAQEVKKAHRPVKVRVPEVKYYLTNTMENYRPWEVIRKVNGQEEAWRLKGISNVCGAFNRQIKEVGKGSIFVSQDDFIFGIRAEFGSGKEIQETLTLLHNASAVFIKKEIYDEYAKLYKETMLAQTWTEKDVIVKQEAALSEGIEKFANAKKYLDKKENRKKISTIDEEFSNMWHDASQDAFKRFILSQQFYRFNKVYFPSWSPTLLTEFSQFHLFLGALYATNTILAHSESLSQQGDRQEMKQYLALNMQVLQKEIAQMKQ